MIRPPARILTPLAVAATAAFACGDGDDATRDVGSSVRLVDRIAEATVESAESLADDATVFDWASVPIVHVTFGAEKDFAARHGPALAELLSWDAAADGTGSDVQITGSGAERHAVASGPAAICSVVGPLGAADYQVDVDVWSEGDAEFELSLITARNRGDGTASDPWLSRLQSHAESAGFKLRDAASGRRRATASVSIQTGQVIVIGVLVRSGTVHVDDLHLRRISATCDQLTDDRRLLTAPWVRRIQVDETDRESIVVIPPGAVRMPLSLDGGGAIVRGSVARLDRFGAAVQVEAVASIDGVERARTEARLDATRPRWTPLSIDLTGLSGDIELALTATPAEADDARFAVAFGSFTVEVVGDPPDAPDVVLVSLDTMRADRMSVNGYGRETTPRLEQIADRSVVFDRAIAPSSWTLPSHATLFSGQLPSRHQVTNATRRIDPDVLPLLAAEFRAAGYQTVAVTAGGFIDPDFGFAAGFEEYWTVDPANPLLEARENTAQRVRAARARAVDLLGAERHRPLFLFVHTYAAHNYLAPADDLVAVGADRGAVPALQRDTGIRSLRGRMSEAADEGDVRALFSDELDPLSLRYDAAMRVADDLVGDLWSALQANSRVDRTLLVVTSDHGEELGEHGSIGHNSQLYEALVRVPLIVNGLGLAPRRSDRMVSLADVAPTIRELVGLAARSDAVDGRSLTALLRGEPLPPEPTILHQGTERAGSRALRGDRWKLIVHLHDDDGTPELYDLGDDPTEQRDLSTARADMLGKLRRVLEERMASMESKAAAHDEGVLSPARVAELKELGYLGG